MVVLKLINIPNADINGIIYNVVFNVLICFCGNNFLLNPFIMVEVWAMNPTPNSMYMAHQYRCSIVKGVLAQIRVGKW